MSEMKLRADNPYSVKSVKYFRDHESNPKGQYTLTLFRNGKKIGYVSDDGWGGGCSYDLIDNEEQILHDHMATYPEIGDGRFKYKPNADCLMDVLINAFEELKQFKRKSKKDTCTLYKTADQKEGEYWLSPVPWNPTTKALLLKKHPDIVEFINERWAK